MLSEFRLAAHIPAPLDGEGLSWLREGSQASLSPHPLDLFRQPGPWWGLGI